MRIFFTACIILLSFRDSEAQGVKQDVELLLKNGNILNGHVLTDDIPKQITIFTSDTDSLNIPYSQIANIKYAEIGNNRIKNSGKGFFNVTEVGLLFGNVNNDGNVSTSMSAQTTFGFGFNRLIKAGMGAGYDQYDDAYTLPVYLSIRGDVFNRKISPVYFINAGYAAAWSNETEWQNWADVKGGKMIDGGIGIRFASTDGYCIIISLGYKVQNLNYTALNWEGQVSSITERENRRLRFSIGVGF